MPVNDYRCGVCGFQFQKEVQPPSDPDTMVCPNCTSLQVDRLVSMTDDVEEGCNIHIPGFG